MTAAELVARARARRLVPDGLARPLFWRLAVRDQEALSGVVVESVVTFAGRRELRLRLDLSSRPSWTMLFHGFDAAGDEAPMIKLFCERALRSSCTIDVGVNHGLYLYHAVACSRPGAKLLGIEANPALVESVNENLRRNGIDPLVTLAALTDTDGPVRLHLAHDDQLSSLHPEYATRYGGTTASVTVPGVSLDSLIEQRDLSPDLIKIDVEGHERAVLAGARRTLAAHHPTLFIEVTPETFEDVDTALRAAGYRGSLFTADGLREPQRALIATRAYCNLLYEPSARASRS